MILVMQRSPCAPTIPSALPARSAPPARPATAQPATAQRAQVTRPALLTLFTLSLVFDLLLASCASPVFWPQFVDTLFDAPRDGVSRLTIRNGQVFAYSAPVRSQDVPEKVKRTMDELREGGQTVYLAREWGPRGTAYRIEDLVRVSGRDELRSLLVDDEGHVVGRSYEITPADAPSSMLDHATTMGLGRDRIRKTSVVLGSAGDPGHYRMLLEDREGRLRMLECRADGTGATWSRIIQAEVTCTR